MRLATLAGLYVAVVLSAQIGAQRFIRLAFTHLLAPRRAYSIAPLRVGRRFLPANRGDNLVAA